MTTKVLLCYADTDGSPVPATATSGLPVISESSEESFSGTVPTPLRQYLSTNGDGTGDIEAIGDYSTTSDIFYIQPASNQVFRIQRMLLSLEDSTGMGWNEYGHIGSGLTSGILFRVQNDSTTVHDLLAGRPVKTNGEWAENSYDVEILDTTGGNDYFVIGWDFTIAGFPIRLNGAASERLEFVVQDDLTGLVAHRIKVEGYIEPSSA